MLKSLNRACRSDAFSSLCVVLVKALNNGNPSQCGLVSNFITSVALSVRLFIKCLHITVKCLCDGVSPTIMGLYNTFHISELPKNMQRTAAALIM